MKRISRMLSALVLFLTIPFLTASAQDYTRTFSASPGGELRLDIETGGSIVITGWSRSEIEINIFVSGRDDGDVIVDFDETRNGLSVKTEFERRRSRADVDIEVSVPARFDLDIETVGGEVRIDGVEGRIEGETMGGDLDFKNLKGDIEFTTMGGSITM